jgi:hypothetical protein
MMKGKIDRHRSIIKNLIRYSFCLGSKVRLAIFFQDSCLVTQ